MGEARKVAWVSDLVVEKPVMANSNPDAVREAMISRVTPELCDLTSGCGWQAAEESFHRSGQTR